MKKKERLMCVFVIVFLLVFFLEINDFFSLMEKKIEIVNILFNWIRK